MIDTVVMHCVLGSSSFDMLSLPGMYCSSLFKINSIFDICTSVLLNAFIEYYVGFHLLSYRACYERFSEEALV